jgi:hypothetical protein
MVAKTPARKRDDVTVGQKRDHDDTLPKGPGSPARFKGKKRGPGLSFKEGALKKALKVVAKHGGGARIEIMLDGRINIIPAGEGPAAQASNDLDKWLASKNAHQA